MFYKTKKNTSGYETDIDFYELEKALSVTKSKKKKKWQEISLVCDDCLPSRAWRFDSIALHSSSGRVIFIQQDAAAGFTEAKKAEIWGDGYFF